MRVTCEGGMLDGRVFDKAEPEPVIHQSGMVVLKVHRPYPKRKGEKVVERLLTYTEGYALHETEKGPVYRCFSPLSGVFVGEERIERSEDGTYEVWADRAGKLHARPCESTQEGATRP